MYDNKRYYKITNVEKIRIKWCIKSYSSFPFWDTTLKIKALFEAFSYAII